jgi:hypothetical protein
MKRRDPLPNSGKRVDKTHLRVAAVMTVFEERQDPARVRYTGRFHGHSSSTRPLLRVDVFWHALHVYVWFAREISVF